MPNTPKTKPPPNEHGSLSVRLAKNVQIDATGPAIAMVPVLMRWVVIALICLAVLTVLTGGNGVNLIRDGFTYAVQHWPRP